VLRSKNGDAARIPFSEQRARTRRVGGRSLIPHYESRFKGFHDLMRFRVREILLVSTLYDAWVLEEDRNLSERIFSEYLELDLRYVPRITRVNTGEEALNLMGRKTYNLVLCMTRLPDLEPLEFRRKAKIVRPKLRIIFLTYDAVDKGLLESLREKSDNDRIFFWLRDTNILLSIVKYVEDQKNVYRDARAGVQVVLLVEDSPRFYSRFLPLIYTALLTQTRRLINEGLNSLHRLQRLRARPKILLAETFEQANSIFKHLRHNIIGVISDVRFPMQGEHHPEAGFKLAEMARSLIPELPFILQSSEPHNESLAHKHELGFLYKHSGNLEEELRCCIQDNFGFGDFRFRRPNRNPVGNARDLHEFYDVLRTVPEESIAFHAAYNHFSTWLRARTEFELAEKVRRIKVSDYPQVSALREALCQLIGQHNHRAREGLVGDFQAGRLQASDNFIKLGAGSLGGKARGLAFINALLARNQVVGRYENTQIRIPNTFVLATDVYEEFLQENKLKEWAIRTEDEEKIVERFLNCQLPRQIRRDLFTLLNTETYPIAVRSSSLLEDNQSLPFAGIYKTFMLPNNHPDLKRRFKQLNEAIKMVYASIFSHSAKEYTRNTGYRVDEERMAVIIQQVAGETHRGLHYPTFSGVARSYNYYPYSDLKPEEGTASLALGLGKSIVESEKCFHFCPAHPRMNPPYSSAEELLQNSQTSFYALDVSQPELSITNDESFSLQRLPISQAEEDGVLQLIASTYSPQNRSIRDTLMVSGPRVLRFAQVLKYNSIPLPEIVQDLLEAGERSFGSPVEIEFAVSMDPQNRGKAEFHFLQIRPILMSDLEHELKREELEAEGIFASSIQAMGNGIFEDLYDLIFIDPERFDILRTREIVQELSQLNRQFVEEGRRYILLGFGRWGTSDPCLGVPVQWKQVSQAQVFLEADRHDLWVEPSQGSHFFQNMLALRLGYLFIKESRAGNHVDWSWLMKQRPQRSTKHLRHLRFDDPILVEIDGRSSRGLIRCPVGE